MKSVLAGLVLAFSFNAFADQCDVLSDRLIKDWRSWSDKENKTESYTLKYKDAEKVRNGGLLVLAKKGGKTVKNIDPLSVSIDYLNAKGEKVLSFPNDKLQIRNEAGTDVTQITLRKTFVAQIDEQTSNTADGGSFVVNYYGAKKDTITSKAFKGTVVATELSSPSGRNAKIIMSGSRKIGVVIPGTEVGFTRAYVFSPDCQIEKIVYEDQGEIKDGPTRKTCSDFRNRSLSASGGSVDANASWDCQKYDKIMPRGTTSGAPAEATGSAVGS